MILRLALIGAISLLYPLGYSLDNISLLGITLAVGLVVDDAIVVLENIYRFIEEKKQDPFKAAVEATKEIGLAVLATTPSPLLVASALLAVGIPVLARTRFPEGAAAFGLIMSLFGGGALLGTALAGGGRTPARRRHGGHQRFPDALS